MSNFFINNTIANQQLLSRKQAAELLGCKESTLAVWACNKRYPLPFVKIGRLVKYRLEDLQKFIASRTIDQQERDVMLNTVKEIKSLIPIRELFERDGHVLQRSGNHYVTLCPFHEEKNPSCHVYDDHFYCYACGANGDIINYELLKIGANKNDKESFKTIIKKFGESTGTIILPSKSHSAFAQQPMRTSIKPSEPISIQNQWHEGIVFLKSRIDYQLRIAEWRGWSEEFVQTLIEEQKISAPLYNGIRVLAFSVESLVSGHTTSQVGMHLRAFPEDESKLKGWRYLPKGTLGIPFFLGNFYDAKLLIILEGAWDACSFAYACGFLSADNSFPQDICILGIRGASGINAFLSHYKPYWPDKCSALIIRDNDATGEQWITSRSTTPSFGNQLQELCTSVKAIKGTAFKDFNDFTRVHKPTIEEIGKFFIHYKLTSTNN